MQFQPYSGIQISKKSNGLVKGDAKPLAEFWQQVDDAVASGLSEAVGCYIFAIKAGKGILPWYVGKAEKQSFKKECFTSHKLKHYNDAAAGRKGTPYLFLIAKITNGGKFSKVSGNGHRDIQFLENMLIAACIQRNSYLLNIKDTKLLREMVVPGLLNNPPGPNPGSVNELKRLIGL